MRGQEVLLVHRPRYADWTFPKGKCGEDESDEACALREVEEETGLRCRLGRELGSTSYTDGRGRPKVVRYWLMEPLGGEFAANAEVDAVRWVDAETARGLLSYGRDAPVLQELRLGGEPLAEQLADGALADAARAEPERDGQPALHLGEDDRAGEQRLRPLRRDPQA